MRLVAPVNVKLVNHKKKYIPHFSIFFLDHTFQTCSLQNHTIYHICIYSQILCVCFELVSITISLLTQYFLQILILSVIIEVVLESIVVEEEEEEEVVDI